MLSEMKDFLSVQPLGIGMPTIWDVLVLNLQRRGAFKVIISLANVL